MEFELWWLWFALAAILLVGEILTAGFFLMWFSIGAAVAGVLALLGVGRVVQLVVFILASAILFLLGRRFAERVTTEQPPGIGADRFAGQTGIVIEEVNNLENSGRVRVGRDEWRATGESEEVIPSGTRVKVVRIDGTHAIVAPQEEDK